jgi:ABC-type antimicrobial peptide transport system permease subunit
VVSTVALGIAAMLVMFLEGTSRWVTTSSTAYVDHIGSELVVAQTGIEDLLFAQSVFPTTTMDQVGRLPGVAAVNPVVGINGVVSVRGTHLPMYLVGFHAGHPGGPWQVKSGSAEPHGNEVIIDRGFATDANAHVGDTLTILGRQLRVVGISTGTNAAGDFFLFAPTAVAESIAGAGSVSFGLVKLADGASADQVAAQIDRLPGVHALKRQALAANDRDMITTSFSQPLQIVAVVGLIAGVLIAGIVLYTATVEHSRDYAVLKAVGAPGAIVYGSALLQSIVLSFFGVLLGWGLAAALAAGFDTWQPIVQSQLDIDLILTVGGVIVAINVLAALLPVHHVSQIDPQEVFKA